MILFGCENENEVTDSVWFDDARTLAFKTGGNCAVYNCADYGAPSKVTVNGTSYYNHMYDGLRGKLEIYDLSAGAAVVVSWPIPTPPEGYFVTSVYGTGGIYVDENNVVSVQGDGNIVAILSSTANPGEPPGSTPDGGGGWEVIDKNKVIIQALGGLMSAIGIIFLIAAGKQGR